MYASPEAVGPDPRPMSALCWISCGYLLPGLTMREFPPSRLLRRYADGSDMLISSWTLRGLRPPAALRLATPRSLARA
jgi:hypothetical protein